MEPINYAGQFSQQPAIGDQFLQGLQITQAMQAQAEARRQAEAQAKAKAEQEAAMQADIMDVYNRGAPAEAVSRLVIKYPHLAKEYKDAHEMRSKDEQIARKAFGAQVDSALQSGKVDIAKQLIDQRIQAAENSGNAQEAQAWKATRQVVETDPNAAKLMSSSYMAAIDEKYASNIATAGQEARNQALFPSAKQEAEGKASEAVSRAQSAAVAAKFAESNAVKDLEKKGWDIQKIQADIQIARQNAAIAAANVGVAREGNSLKRQEMELKLREMIDKRDATVREKVATAESGAAAMDNMLNTIQRVLKNPSLNDVVGSLEGRLPSFISDQGADAIALIDTLGSQAFLAQIPNVKGMGALSNAEGEKLQSALQNLSRTQSEEQFKASLKEASRLVLKARKNLEKSTGVPLSRPDTPAAMPSDQELDSLLKKYGAK